MIAHIPIFLEKDAYNAVESYELSEDGSILTTFRFNKGSFDGPQKTMNPKAFVYNTETNAEWRMQFLWPFKAVYLITYLADDYDGTGCRAENTLGSLRGQRPCRMRNTRGW